MSPGALDRLRRNGAARVARAFVALFLVGAVIGPLFWPYLPIETLDIVRLQNAPPSLAHPFGTDSLSRDLLARVLFGARISLSVALLSVLLSTTFGSAYGLIAGYAGGRVDAFMMRTLDAMVSVPRILLLMAAL